MGANRPYRGVADLPRDIPVFPLPGALLLPRCELPLNIFEPRYIAMIDAALGGGRLIGMIQPARESVTGTSPELQAVGCAGRLMRFAETQDGRYIVSLEGVCRFRIAHEIAAKTPFRSFSVNFEEFSDDLVASHGEDAIDREAVLRALRDYAEKHALSIDWKAISGAPGETLVNVLSMMSPFGPREKQALLEASDLRARADMLVAITEMDLAGDERGRAPLN